MDKQHAPYKNEAKRLRLALEKLFMQVFIFPPVFFFCFLLHSEFAFPSLCCERIKKLFRTFETIVENLFEQDVKTIPNKFSFMHT